MNETWLTGRYLLNGNILHHSFLNLLNEHPVVKEFVEKRKFWCERAEISLELKWILRKKQIKQSMLGIRLPNDPLHPSAQSDLHQIHDALQNYKIFNFQ